jgi:glycopeptide antibiotics resistance protein
MKKLLLFSLISSMILFLIVSPFLKDLMAYLHPIVLFVVFFCIAAAVFFLALLFRKITLMLRYSHLRIIILLYSISLMILLFFRPSDQNYQSVNLIPFSTIAFYLSGEVNGLISFYNLAANIVLFLPFGIFLKVKKLPPIPLFAFPIFIISLIELLQYFTHRGSLDIDDLILNIFGFYIGYLLFPLFNRIIKITF